MAPPAHTLNFQSTGRPMTHKSYEFLTNFTNVQWYCIIA